MNRYPMIRMALVLSIAFALPAPSLAEQTDAEYTQAMEREHAGDQPVASPAAAAEPDAAVRTEAVYYARIDDKEIKGFLAMPFVEKGPYPGIIVIHEWWGLNDNIRSMAKQLAAQGYAALAVDLYEGEYAGDRAGASALMQKWMAKRGRLEDNLRQAIHFLEDRQNAPRVGTIGWCFGGAWSLQTALLFPSEIDATVIYYGRLVTDEQQLKRLEAPILGLFGSADQGIPVESVHEFQAALEALGKPASIEIYEGADHAFANPSGTHYQAAAAEDAWKKTVAFFAKTLQKKD